MVHRTPEMMHSEHLRIHHTKGAADLPFHRNKCLYGASPVSLAAGASSVPTTSTAHRAH